MRDIDFIGKRKSRKLLLNSSLVKSGSSSPLNVPAVEMVFVRSRYIKNAGPVERIVLPF